MHYLYRYWDWYRYCSDGCMVNMHASCARGLEFNSWAS